jgi:hypothetical protein
MDSEVIPTERRVFTHVVDTCLDVRSAADEFHHCAKPVTARSLCDHVVHRARSMSPVR